VKRYSVGFMFGPGLGQVALIRKARPEWQRGKLNGVGGHIEEGETPRQAMVREFKEETGVETYESDWTFVVVLTGPGYELNIFKARAMLHHSFTTQTDEPVNWVTSWNLPHDIIPNLRWIIPLCWDESLVLPVQMSVLR
jgi:8-oxo-dGTP diphosphatase